jgi:glucoamylase
LYTINGQFANDRGIATGRYAEDVYYLGQPWYLTTFAVAEQLYDAIQQWSTFNSLSISDVDLAFWKSFYPSAKVGTYKKGKEFDKMLNAVLTYADSFVEVALKYTPSSGELSEQFSRENGTQVSARHLTWSYASFVTMRSARKSATSNYPQVPSWGAPTGNKVPANCEADSAVGTYSPAVAAGAPPGAGGCTLLVKFNVNASTFFGENIYLSGSTTDLGSWVPSDSLAMSASQYTEARPLWTVDVELPANSTVHYTYLRKQPDGKWLNETSVNTYDVPICANVIGPGKATVEDAWEGPVGTPPTRLF